MTSILSKYKKRCVIIGVIVAAALLFVYLRALFLPGLWHGDAFLYKKGNGSFAGSDAYADYKMTVNTAPYGADIKFSVNDNTKHYQIKYDRTESSTNVEIVENDKTVFKGKTFSAGDEWFLFDENHNSLEGITVHTGNYEPTEDELFPGYTKLYNWAVSKKTDTRGEPYMIFIILLLGIVLFLDIKFPTLFWLLEHRLDVDGGEPSDWYLFGQKVGRVLISIGILICMVLTFILH